MADRPGVIHEWPSGLTYQQMTDVAVATYGAGSPEVVNLSLSYDPQPARRATPPMDVLPMVGVGAFVVVLFLVLNRI